MKIYTDGSCIKNPGGKGGWAFVVMENDANVYQLSGSDPSTTNNRMELLAVINAVRWVRSQSDYENINFEIVTDSKYVCGGCANFKPYLKSSRPNHDLWRELNDIWDSRFIVSWVKGHAESEGNNLADTLANKEAGIGPNHKPWYHNRKPTRRDVA